MSIGFSLRLACASRRVPASLLQRSQVRTSSWPPKLFGATCSAVSSPESMLALKKPEAVHKADRHRLDRFLAQTVFQCGQETVARRPAPLCEPFQFSCAANAHSANPLARPSTLAPQSPLAFRAPRSRAVPTREDTLTGPFGARERLSDRNQMWKGWRRAHGEGPEDPLLTPF